jgi:ATP-dependent DNA helicase RecG
MEKFRSGEYQILVSTSVVEVGVDIPNATVMLIEGANRFGLAQLHQFRGRVGRGNVKSYCLLIPDSADAAENERLSAMVKTNDGFELAEIDLNQRGPGDFLGTRQSGYTKQLQMASLTDLQLIEKAQHAAKLIHDRDPYFNQPEHSQLAETLAHFWGEDEFKPQADVS